MKRATHILLGAAVAMPIAASLTPIVAAGVVWWGMVGGGYPDWLDLRSDFNRQLKHRGISHSLFPGAIFAIGLWLMLGLVNDQFDAIQLGQSTIDAWALAFAAGFLSHIVADACTVAGVRPLLPISKRRWWVLPRQLRSTSSGALDTIVRFLAILVLIVSVSLYVSPFAIW